MKRHLLGALLAVLLVIGVPIFGIWLVKRPLPQLDGRTNIGGLSNAASVAFDGRGIPYIEARSDSDAYLVQGYITARDRMFQMDILRRMALGQMSEIFGASWLPTDRLMHTLSIKKLAYSEFNNASAQSKSALESYARGVNEYISESANKLPLQFMLLGYSPQTWHAEDSLAILKYQAYIKDESWRLDDFRQRVANRIGDDLTGQLFADDLLAFGTPKPKETAPSTGQTQGETKPATTGKKETAGKGAKPAKTSTPAPAKKPVTKPPAKTSDPTAWSGTGEQLLNRLAAEGDVAQRNMRSSPLMGSTTWAVPAKGTSTGGAMLACISDGPLTSPSEWYLCSLNSPGLHVAGASMPGVPGVMVGRNENIAWGSSALKADVQDIFLEQFKSEFDTSYRTAQGWQQADVDTELIPVRFGKDVEYKVLATTHGPVLMRNKNVAVSLSWTGLDTAKPSFDSIYKINRATSANEFVSAVAEYHDPPTLFVFADRFGNIGCQASGNIPVRSDGGTGTKLNVGWETKGTWESMVPFNKLPSALVAFSPIAGASRTPIIAANQKPATYGDALPQLTDDSIQLGHQWAPPYRANRLLNALTQAKTLITPADMVALAGDQYTQLAPVLSAALLDAGITNHLIDRNGTFAIEMLKRWDGQMKIEGMEGSIYQSFMQVFARRLVEPRLGRVMATEYMQRWPMWLTFAQSVMQNKPVAWLAPEERTYDGFFLTTLTQGLKSLRITLDTTNPVEWPWGKIHQAIFEQIGGSDTGWFTHYYRVGPVPVGGAPECINSCDVMFDPAGLNFNALNGPTQRMIVDMADHDKFYQSICTGQSGQLTSEFRKDQLKSWAAVDLLPIAFSSDQLLRQTKHRLTLDTE
jgi:penicillin amidase